MAAVPKEEATTKKNHKAEEEYMDDEIKNILSQNSEHYEKLLNQKSYSGSVLDKSVYSESLPQNEHRHASMSEEYLRAKIKGIVDAGGVGYVTKLLKLTTELEKIKKLQKKEDTDEFVVLEAARSKKEKRLSAPSSTQELNVKTSEEVRAKSAPVEVLSSKRTGVRDKIVQLQSQINTQSAILENQNSEIKRLHRLLDPLRQSLQKYTDQSENRIIKMQEKIIADQREQNNQLLEEINELKTWKNSIENLIQNLEQNYSTIKNQCKYLTAEMNGSD